MCGIVGYAGNQQALPILLEGLRRLEYRGYDSAGVAVLDGGAVQVVRKAGKLEVLERELGADDALAGVTGIGHTRWATHGRPTDRNAHPHQDCTGRVAVIHNGIIENFFTLRAQLEREGHRFASQTDTEVRRPPGRGRPRRGAGASPTPSARRCGGWRGRSPWPSCTRATRAWSSGPSATCPWWPAGPRGRTSWPATSRPSWTTPRTG